MPQVNPRQPRQLIVEGNDDKNFFEALIEHAGIVDIEVHQVGGKDAFSSFLSGFAKTSGFGEFVDSIGIVRDADESAARTFQSIRGSLRRAALPVPDEPCIPRRGDPRVNVMVLPGRQDTGMLETLLCETIAGSELDDCGREFMRCVEAAEGRGFRTPHKTRASAFLAAREAHQSVGVAAKQGIWDLNHASLDPVRKFLATL